MSAIRDYDASGSSSEDSSDDEPSGEDDALLARRTIVRKRQPDADIPVHFSARLFAGIVAAAAVAVSVTSWQALTWAQYEKRCSLEGCYDYIPGVAHGKPPDESVEGQHVAGPIAAVVSVAAVAIAAVAAARTLL